MNTCSTCTKCGQPRANTVHPYCRDCTREFNRAQAARRREAGERVESSPMVLAREPRYVPGYVIWDPKARLYIDPRDFFKED